MKRRFTRAAGLISGGLDSILAVKVLQAQGIDVVAVTFLTHFFGPEPGIRAAQSLHIPVHVLDIADRHLEMLKQPVFGYGRYMNPCIDCHALMLKAAGEVLDTLDADFLFTGEVLGQRPMSQRRDALKMVEELAGQPGRILRPLSARLLPPTEMERSGLVDRERLLDLQGRSRKAQQGLARSFGIVDFPQPGGGCILTKEGFSRKLAAMLKHVPHASGREMELLKWGRQYVMPGGSLCFLGRNERDNERLEGLAREEDCRLRAADHPSPVGLLLVSPGMQEDRELAAMLVAACSDAPLGSMVRVVTQEAGRTVDLWVMKRGREDFLSYLV